jgi:superfamily II DNA/RNA helicase
MIVLSATYPSYMATYVTRYMRSATFVRLNIVDPSLRGIKQFYKLMPYNELKNINFDSKINELLRLFSSIQFKQCIVFTNYQLRAENICQKLIEQGWPAIFIAGNIEQAKRTKAIMQLKQFKCRILVSTDLVRYIFILI